MCNTPHASRFTLYSLRFTHHASHLYPKETKVTGGYIGKYCIVNLSTGNIEIIEPGEDFYKKYLSGYGLGAAVLMRYLKPGADPLSPENHLGFCSGLLTGAGAYFSGRLIGLPCAMRSLFHRGVLKLKTSDPLFPIYEISFSRNNCKIHPHLLINFIEPCRFKLPFVFVKILNTRDIGAAQIIQQIKCRIPVGRANEPNQVQPLI